MPLASCLFPVPHSLLPTPYSLLPFPYSLLPTPDSLLPTPYSLPCLVFPKPWSTERLLHNFRVGSRGRFGRK
ncbi:MAG: hypothetical protein F6K50_43650 [Moorea sp. SIO3I7]|nr:hypothetical protein [Moorena sp. SIO3I7]NEO06159.1 hypothetical protein [Moorena sp. SIO3I8]